MSLDDRQTKLLTHILEEFIESTIPVGSLALAEKYDLQVSPATIRNDMGILVEKGYISQPHISAGRIPTQAAYEYWIENTRPETIKKSEKEALRIAQKESNDQRENFKSVAKKLSGIVNNAVVVAFNPNDFYYTGLSALFSHPEFSEQSHAISIASVIDHLDQTLINLVKILEKNSVLIGKDNPFSENCGFVGTIINNGCIGILGPMRMHYPKNISRIKFIDEQLNN